MRFSKEICYGCLLELHCAKKIISFVVVFNLEDVKCH